MRRLSFEVEKLEGDKLEEEEEEEFYSFPFDGLPPALPRPRRSFHRSSRKSLHRTSTSSSLSLSLTSALSYVSSRKSFCYDKLAQVPIQLTVLKLDGTSFEINVLSTATIAELKQAVERVFSHLPTKGPGKISWRHVWGNFCLSYDGSKLLSDTDNITVYGIKDGDKLHFVRHASITYNLIKKRSSKKDTPKPRTIAENHEEEGQQVEEDSDDLENLKHQQNKLEVEGNSTSRESVLCRLFRGWILYSKLQSTDHLRLEGSPSPSHSRHSPSPSSTRWAGGFVGCFRSLFQFCDNRPPSYSSRVSRVEI